MKNLNLKHSVLTTLFSTVLGVLSLFAEKKPPMPRGSGGFSDDVVVGQTPIDHFIPLLIIGAVLLGIWAINKYKMQKIQ
jgi:hypothetical protein